MIDTIWHLRGSVALTKSGDVALDRIQHLLKKQQKPIAERGQDYLTFDDPLLRNLSGSNWLAMAIYDHGRFWVNHDLDSRQICYELRSLHGMLFCLFLAIAFFAFGFVGESLSRGLALAAFAFG